MVESGARYRPKTAEEILAEDIRQQFKRLLDISDRWLEGMSITWTGLTLHVAIGKVYINGNFVEFDSQVNEALSSGDATYYVFAEDDADITVNTSGVPPANSIKIWEVDVVGGVVDDTRDFRDDTVSLTVPFSADGLDAQGGEVTSIADATAADSATSKSQVEALIAASPQLYKTVRAATSAAGTLATSFEDGDTIDGVVLATGDRILLKNQASGIENGIYVVAASGAPTRATDADTAADLPTGSLIGVSEGTANADRVFILTTNAGYVIGTDAIAFEEAGVKTHAATTTSGIHGSTSAATINTLVHRNGSGQSSFADGVNPDHAVNKSQLDANATADRARANHTGTQLSTTISDFDEAAQDAVGNILADSATLDFTYTDGGPSITASVKTDSVDNTLLANMGTKTIKGRTTAATGDPEDLTPTQAVGVLNNAGEFDTQVRTNRLDQMAAPTAAVSMNTQKITDLAAPTNPNDGVRLADIGGAALTSEWILGMPGPRTRYGITNTDLDPVGIGQSADGTVVVILFIDATGAPKIHYSTDSGRTWLASATNPSSAVSVFGTNGSGDVFVTDANTWSVAYGGANILVFAKTTNGGASWTTNTQALTHTATNQQAKCLGVDSAFYLVSNSTTTVLYGKTSNAGSSFTTGTVASETVVSTGHLALACVDLTTVYAFWEQSATNIRFSKTSDGGANWGSPATVVADAAGASASFQNAVMVDASTVVLAYRTSATRSPIKYVRTTNDGTNWATVRDWTPHTLSQTTLAGAIYMAYHAATGQVLILSTHSSGLGTHILDYSTDDGATWVHSSGFPALDFGNTSLSTYFIQPGRKLLVGPSGNSILLPFTPNTSNVGSIWDIRKVPLLAP